MIKLIADSTCDLSDVVLARHRIGIAPLIIQINGKDYRDRIDIQPDEFYRIMMELEQNPTTAMPSPAEFLLRMEEGIAEGCKEILCICMSSGTSGSYQSAVVAADLFYDKYDPAEYKLHVVDSLCMSHGSGYLILKSAQLREAGYTFEELVSFNETFKKHIKHYLSVDDLDNLIRSGRLTNASAFIGKLLKLKPIMTMKDSRGAIVAKERGRKNVLEHYVREFMRRVDTELTTFIIIGYTSDIAYAENLKAKLLQETGFSGEIHIMQMGVSVGTHVGLGGLSMFFVETDGNRDGLLTNELTSFKMARDEFLEKFKHRFHRS
ncbi:MAG TPA: DegV family protein [Candidatus Acidoferrum sp.]|nr:DegV family protein [Candidatus Acidoferrum sp.]